MFRDTLWIELDFRKSNIWRPRMVACPQWTVQTTNAKLVQDVWKVGMRVKVNVEGLVKSEEIKRCLDIAYGK